MDLSPGTETCPLKGSYARESSLGRMRPPDGMFYPSESGSPVCENKVSVLWLFPGPVGNPFRRTTNPLMESLINVSYPKPI